MKKILIIIPSLKLGGGAEKSATLVGNELYKKLYEISYLTFYQSEKKYDFFGTELCLNENLTTNIFKNIFKLFYRAYEINKYCKKNKIDTVISHLEESNFSSILSKIFLNKSKIICVTHNTTITQPKLYKYLMKNFYNFSDIIVPTSYQMGDELIKNFGLKESKSKTIYNSFELEKIKSLSLESLGNYSDFFNENIFTFINIGRLTKQKNQKLLLEAFDLFYNKYKNSQLIILHGDGELETFLKEFKENMISKNNIHFLGNHINPFKFLKNSDCYVCSSSWEGFSMLFIESMTCGLPFISTDHNSGVKELLRNNNDYSNVDFLVEEDFGILVPDKNSNELFKAMEKIYLNKDLKNKYKEKSLERSKDFDLNSIIINWENIL